MDKKQTLREFLTYFRGQRIHRIKLHYKDNDDNYDSSNVEEIDIDWCDNVELVRPCDRFKYDSWFLNLTERGGAFYYTWFVDKWNIITDPNCKTNEGYQNEEYEDNLQHDFLVLDIWIFN